MKMYLYNYLILFLIMTLIMLIPSNFFKFHPLLLTLMLTLYVLISTMKMNYLNSNSWYSYIMFLIMIGGLMILFMYFTSLANNQLFNLNLIFIMKIFIKMFFFLVMIYTFSVNNNYLLLTFNNFNLETLQTLFMNYKLDSNMMKNLMMDYVMNLNMYIIMYLFFTMICVMMLCYKMVTPMRQTLKY